MSKPPRSAYMLTVRDTPYTVTNSFKRGLMMKTYRKSARPLSSVESRPPKKRRVDMVKEKENEKEQNESENNLACAIRESSAAILSSPTRHASTVFSEELHDDEDQDLSTPPSSPPQTLQLTPPPASTRKPTFSFLKRKRSSTEGTPLTEVNSNSLQNSQQQQPTPLKQMQIDAGADVRKTCSGCGMEYIPSNTEDSSLHKKFHDMNSTGIDLGKAFVRANASRWVYEAARFGEGYVVIIDRKSSPTSKSQAKRVLEVVNKELASPEIEDTLLWSQIETPKRFRKNGSKEEVDRFRVFLHMKDSKCVGLALTERIWESHVAKRGCRKSVSNKDNSSSIALGEEKHPAVVGISRVWTSAASRRRGIAMDLLDCVVGNYFYGMEIPRAQVAFSQPTESGCRFIEAFFGPDEPWHLYKE